MIKYKLSCKSTYCTKENDFEAWFQNIESYETQKISGLINCPRCGGSDVIKLLTAPSLNKLSKQYLGESKKILEQMFLKETKIMNNKLILKV